MEVARRGQQIRRGVHEPCGAGLRVVRRLLCCLRPAVCRCILLRRGDPVRLNTQPIGDDIGERARPVQRHSEITGERT